MKHHLIRRIRGAEELSVDGLDGIVLRIERVHHECERVPFGVLTRIPVVNVYAREVEQVERVITDGVYRSIRGAIHCAGCASASLLDLVDRFGD